MTDKRTAGDTVEVTWCSDCNEVVEGVTVYDCSRCSTRSDERRCPDDNIFMARADGPGCPNCYAEVEAKTMTVDHDGELVEEGDYLPDGEPAAVRQEAERAATSAAQAETRAAKLTVLTGASFLSIWGALKVGERLLPDTDSLMDDETQVVRHVALAADGTTVFVVSNDYGDRFATHPINEVVRVLPATADTTPEPYGQWELLDGAPNGASSPSDQVHIKMEVGTRDVGLVPHLTLIAATDYYQARLASWADPVLAARGLDVLEQAAMRLHALRGTTPANTLPTVTIDDDGGWAVARPSDEVTVHVGVDKWHAEGGGLINVVNQHHSVSVDNPDAVLAAVTAARALLGRLTLIPKTIAAKK